MRGSTIVAPVSRPWRSPPSGGSACCWSPTAAHGGGPGRRQRTPRCRDSGSLQRRFAWGSYWTCAGKTWKRGRNSPDSALFCIDFVLAGVRGSRTHPGQRLLPRNGFEDRERPSRPVLWRPTGAHFVSENRSSSPMLSLSVPGPVAQYGDKWATIANPRARRLLCLRRPMLESQLTGARRGTLLGLPRVGP